MDLHEAKVGFVRGPFAWRQFQKDLALAKAGSARGIEWHFFASELTGKLGPSHRLLAKMEQAAQAAGVSVKFVMHIPAGG
ncbi:hypothetical protein OMK64_06565 [Cellulomonas fimi]|uniref:hypothetical protein n=1 Tax=Cellulomonas fimi TaxID=1708 RepID=UPI00234C7C74|nr:hypothetical protein [Cellulomonas fimi]MDC7121194.1 hypothetical protein [Cellulomonas fimi]